MPSPLRAQATRAAIDGMAGALLIDILELTLRQKALPPTVFG